MAGNRRKAAVIAVAILLGACSTEPISTRSAGSSATPPATAAATPSVEPTASVNPSPPATPFPVRESEEADALFSRPDTCTNPALGYTVTFPDDWYTNTAIGEQAACSWFTPEFFEVDAPGETPEQIWISIGLIEGIFGYNMLTPTESGDEVEIDGYDGHRAEYRRLDDINDTDSDDLTYHYVVPFDTTGPTLIAGTDVDRADDYELAKAVLDRLMASMELDPAVATVRTIPQEPTGPTISGDPVMEEDSDDSFRLTLEVDQDRYRAGQEIAAMATLTYLGPGDTIVARGSSNPGLIGFAVEGDDPRIRITPAFTTDCAPHEMTRGVAVEYPFAKSGGYSPDEPLASFYEAYFDSSDLRLPAGTWTITAGGSWYVGDCGDELHQLSASVTVVIEP